MKSKQETYDAVCPHLANQKRRCADEKGRCYLHLGDLSCAVGSLIPPNEYMKVMEENTVFSIQALSDSLFEHNEFILIDLQHAHDSAKSGPESLRMTLRFHAEHHGVTPGAEGAITEWHG